MKDASGEDGLLLSDEADAEILYEALGAMSCDLDMYSHCLKIITFLPFHPKGKAALMIM